MDAQLYRDLFKWPSSEIDNWKKTCKVARMIHMKARANFLDPGASIKEFVTVRFINNPITEKVFPEYRKCNELFQIRGVAMDIGEKRIVEQQKDYICSNPKCKNIIVCNGNYNRYFAFEPPAMCPECYSCRVKSRSEVPMRHYLHAMQEILLKEDSEVKLCRINTMKVTLEDDIVDKIEHGDVVIVVGTLESRHQTKMYDGKSFEMEFVLRANSIQLDESKCVTLSEEDRFIVEDEWFSMLNENGEFGARDHLIASFEPGIYGMMLPKFLLLLSSASSVKKNDDDIKRAHSHILLIGATSVAKTHLLLRAAELSPKGYYANCE